MNSASSEPTRERLAFPKKPLEQIFASCRNMNLLPSAEK